MGFPRWEYWSGLPFPSLGDLLDPGIEPGSPALVGRSFTTEPPGKPLIDYYLQLKSEVAQSYLTLCNPIDFSLPGSSVHGIFQARISEWVAISFSRGSSWPRDQTWVSCIAGRCFTIWTTREAHNLKAPPDKQRIHTQYFQQQHRDSIYSTCIIWKFTLCQVLG